MSERIELRWLGKVLGTISGWDGDPGEDWWGYEFEPAEGVALPKCSCLRMDEDEGKITAEDAEGQELEVFEIEWGIKGVTKT